MYLQREMLKRYQFAQNILNDYQRLDDEQERSYDTNRTPLRNKLKLEI